MTRYLDCSPSRIFGLLWFDYLLADGQAIVKPSKFPVIVIDALFILYLRGGCFQVSG